MARNRDMEPGESGRPDDESTRPPAQKDALPRGKGRKEKAAEGAAHPEERKKKRRDRFSWMLVALAVIFVLCMRFGSSLKTPWQEMAVVFQFLCPAAALGLFFWAYPHPLRMMNVKLAAERDALKRESRKKKRRRF